MFGVLLLLLLRLALLVFIVSPLQMAQQQLSAAAEELERLADANRRLQAQLRQQRLKPARHR